MPAFRNKREPYVLVVGSFALIMSTWGMVNSVGVFQTYWADNQLSQYSTSTIGWINSTFIAINLALAFHIGPVFDRFGPAWLIGTGSVAYGVVFFVLGSCTEFWHFLLVFGFLGGTSSAMLSTPAIAILTQRFAGSRGLATGLATTGAGAGGVLFPLVARTMLKAHGWAWATRTLAIIVAVLLLVGNVCVSNRSRTRSTSWVVDLKCFRDVRFVWATLSYCCTRQQRSRST